jgi:hypothetical protein
MLIDRGQTLSRMSVEVFVALVAFGASSAFAAGPPTGLNVRDVANPALQPFQHSGIVVIANNFAGGSAKFTVPAGKRLVIEYASFSYSLSSGDITGVSVGVTTANSNQSPVDHEIPVLYKAVDLIGLPGMRFAGGTPVRLYADPGTEVFLKVGRNHGTGEDIGTVSVSGYFVNLP